jgi:hypothetical protein
MLGDDFGVEANKVQDLGRPDISIDLNPARPALAAHTG